jgi:hypothetical protein
MKIDSYILERLRADAAHTIAVAECEDAIQHHGLCGRFREILIAILLAPWLPPFCKCATGMIVESRNKTRKWWTLSANQNNADAKKYLSVLERSMSADQIAEGQKLVRNFRPQKIPTVWTDEAGSTRH